MLKSNRVKTLTLVVTLFFASCSDQEEIAPQRPELSSPSVVVDEGLGSSSINCNEYPYERGYNHARNVRQDCALSQEVLDATYQSHFSNPCTAYRLGFKEAWTAYKNYCSTQGDEDNGGDGGPGPGDDPDPRPGDDPEI